MNNQNSPQPKYILTVCITLVLCVLVFALWLPGHIQEKADLALKALEEQNKVVAVNKDKASQELIDFVKKHQTAVSETDSLDEKALAKKFEELNQDFIDNADRIIQNRFKVADNEFYSSNQEDFAIPAGLEEEVKFWTHIFGLYTNDHVIFYNAEDVGVVYSVLDFSDVESIAKNGYSIKKKLIAEERSRLKKTLKKLGKKLKREKQEDGSLKTKISLSGLTDEEKRIAKLLVKSNALTNLDSKSLVKSMAYRKGFAHRIKKAIQTSSLYMPEMQRIFRERGLPEELTMIPFIESAFNLNAYSRAGAAGIWQFIEPTGKRYLRIDEYTDERYDPILAAYAAATHLTNEFELLGKWPLTVNAYNTGPGRIQQAMRQLKTTDIATIIQNFKGSGYGFDSRNYYPEFLAVLDVYRNKEYYFGDIKDIKTQEYVYVAMPSPMNVKELVKLSGVNHDQFINLNLGLKPAVVNGDLALPKGYLIKIPPQAKENVVLAMQELFDEIRYASHHVATPEDSLRKIARHYDVKLKDLANYNNMLPNQKLTAGAIVKLPNRENDTELSMDTSGSDMVIPDKLHTPIF